jgi:hypothetical protein
MRFRNQLSFTRERPRDLNMPDKKPDHKNITPLNTSTPQSLANNTRSEQTNRTKSETSMFSLEGAFPSLSNLLDSYVFPDLDSEEVVVVLDTNALLLPFEISQADLSSLEPDPKASGADDSGVIHGFRDNSEALIRDVDASA